MNTITVHFELNSKARPDKRYDILIRFSENRKMKRISTKILVTKQDFNARARHGQWVKPTDPFARKKNLELIELRYKAESAQREAEKKGLSSTLDNVVSIMKGQYQGRGTSFITYFQGVCEQLKQTKKVNTYKKYCTSIKKLKLYCGNKDMMFTDFTSSFLLNYEAHMQAQDKKTNTVTKELKVLRAVFYRAVKEDIYQFVKNPFFGVVLKNGKSNKTKLTFSEIEKLELLELPVGSSLWDTRNFFLFSYYCFGIRFADFTELKWSNVKDNRIEYQMGKTEQPKSIPVHPRVTKILEHYRKYKKSDNDFIFPLLNSKVKYSDPFVLKNKISSRNTIVNKNLKKLAKLADIDKPISFHIARHSFADVARSHGVDLYSISKSLGHSSLSITERYLSTLDQTSVDNEIMNKMFQ